MEKKLGENIKGQARTLTEEIDALIKSTNAIDSRESKTKLFEILGRTFAIFKELGVHVENKEGNEFIDITGKLTDCDEEGIYKTLFEMKCNNEKENHNSIGVVTNILGDMLLTRAINYKDSGKVNESIRCYEIAFAFGRIEAGAMLANMYMNADKNKAKKYLIETIVLCEYKDSELDNYKSFLGWAYTNLGTLYVEADEDSLSNIEAVECFKRGAALGNAVAYFYLGSMYENGSGCQINEEMAKECYEKASELGNKTVEFLLLNKLAVAKK